MDIIPKWVQSLSEKILPPIWLVAAICFFCGMLGYLPKEKLSALRLPENDAAFYQVLRVIFCFTLVLLVMALLRYLVSLGRRALQKAKPPRFDKMTDHELATLYLLDLIPGKKLKIHDDWDIKKLLVDKSLIETHFSGFDFVPKGPFDSYFESYYMTDLGKTFMRKNKKKLDEMFLNKEQEVAALVNPYLKVKVDYSPVQKFL